jgi:hypothetical protein
MELESLGDLGLWRWPFSTSTYPLEQVYYRCYLVDGLVVGIEIRDAPAVARDMDRGNGSICIREDLFIQ